MTLKNLLSNFCRASSLILTLCSPCGSFFRTRPPTKRRLAALSSLVCTVEGVCWAFGPMFLASRKSHRSYVRSFGNAGRPRCSLRLPYFVTFPLSLIVIPTTGRRPILCSGSQISLGAVYGVKAPGKTFALFKVRRFRDVCSSSLMAVLSCLLRTTGI